MMIGSPELEVTLTEERGASGVAAERSRLQFVNVAPITSPKQTDISTLADTLRELGW
jgi:hypothetical protein